jgi:predicted RNA-binding Zn ribbon-like protein
VDVDTKAPLLGEPLPVELMNTLWADRDGVHDALADPAGAVAWLRAVGPRAEIPADGLGVPGDHAEAEAVARQLRQLRDALRRLAAEVTGDPRPTAGPASRSAAIDTINRAAAVAPSWPELNWPDGGPATRQVRSRGPAARTLLSAVAAQAAVLFAGPDQPRLRACLAPGCVLYFVQNHPRREWCSAGCGNRARVARHYRRHHTPNDADR